MVSGVNASNSVLRLSDIFSRVVTIVHPFLCDSSVRNFSFDMYGHSTATYGYFSLDIIRVTFVHMSSKKICLSVAL